MPQFFRNSRTAAKLGALAAVFLLSFSLYGLYCINTVGEVKINGPYYKRIVQGKDVIADILPPPEYLVEAYLTAFQMLHARDGAELEALAGKAAKLEAEYQARHVYWQSALQEDALKRGLVQDSYLPARRMLDAMQREFIPTLRAGDRAKAEAILKEKILPAYLEHRGFIDGVVELAKKRNQEDEARAAVAVDSRTYGQIALGLFLFFLLSIFSSYVLQQIETAAPEADPIRPRNPPKDGTAARGASEPQRKNAADPPDRIRA